MKKFFAVLTVIVLTLLSLSVSAQEIKPATAVPSAETAALREQNAVLKAQLQTMKDNNGAFIDIILWSLGTVAGLAVILVGYNWYTNYRAYDRDKKQFAKEMNEALSTAIAEQEAASTQRLEKELTSQASRVEYAITSLENSIRNNPVLSEINSIRRR